VTTWFWYAVVAAILYGAHQIFTKLAADRIGEGLGGFVVEATAILAGGAAIMAIAGILFFCEGPSWQRIVGTAFAITGLFLLRK
jgi:transporter family protein